MLSNIIAGQTIHEQYGGVVPELASRAHIQHIVPVVDAALKKAGCEMKDLTAIAFTQSPGLIGSLLVGSEFAKSLALAMDIPLLAVHHMQAHVLANLIPRPAARISLFMSHRQRRPHADCALPRTVEYGSDR